MQDPHIFVTVREKTRQIWMAVSAINILQKQKDPIVQVQLMVGLLKGFDMKLKKIVK